MIEPSFGNSLDWRDVIRGANLSGPLKNLAASAQVLDLTRSHVKLRLRIAAFATDTNRQLLSEALARYFKNHCLVEFEVGEVEGETVADAQQRERDEARAKMISDFRNDPFVRTVVERFHATIDEHSIRAADPTDAVEPGNDI